jgi:chromosome segregation protein
MLKALELVGFKSFADKTRFEFPRGITSVVGPNGSGKSNVVDAIKWVLGEQSVKSLRGKEMSDCIFNGSATRHAMNSAETTLTFDNSDHRLPIDSPEVHITRRVYRSGEGEYLINRQPCRLRDIRDLFSGTGVGSDAYGVIEQGKVDVLLQSSPRDRRAIFEEAAGISRFKAKKIESLRRLERVEQNLLRLSDIVEEVDNRLRSVRLQAAKARRYKEHTDRLQELRTQVGLADWRKQSGKLSILEGEVETLLDGVATASAQAEAVEAQALQLETALGDVTETIRTSEARLAENREQVATQEATIEHQRKRVRDLEEEASRHERQLATTNVRAGDLRQQLEDTSKAVADEETRHQQLRRQLAEDEQTLSEWTSKSQTLRQEHDQRRAAQLSEMRTTATLGKELSTLESQIETSNATRILCHQRLAELNQQRSSLAVDLERLGQRQAELTQTLEQTTANWSRARQELSELRRQHSARAAELNQLRQKHTGASERAALLDELEKRLEGVSAGVKDVLVRARGGNAGPLQHVRGLVADLLQVQVEMAPLIEIALGERAQHLVVSKDTELLGFLEQGAGQFLGRVGFCRLSAETNEGDVEFPNLEGQRGVVGRADSFVQITPEFAPLARRLLGHTWIVDRLSHALALASNGAKGVQFVTRNGELLAADGTLSVGPRQAATGLISRRSELRALKQQIQQLETKISQAATEVEQLQTRIAEEEQAVTVLGEEHQRASDALSEQRLRWNASEQRDAQLAQQQSIFESELASAKGVFESASQRIAVTRARLEAIETRLAEGETHTSQLETQIAELDRQREQNDRRVTTAKVELGKGEERLGNLRHRLQQFERDQQERRRSISEIRAQLLQTRQRIEQSESAILQAESQIAELYLRKESLSTETVELVNRREMQLKQRSALTVEAQTTRTQARKLEEQKHAKELAAHEIRLERAGLADRLREDYGIELASLEHQPSDEELHQREEVEAEIAELRRKINNIGSVNLDALKELDELETRYATLSAQFQDLTKAKNLLEQIIGKINADSRRLFAETLEAVKGHFQALFRKLFGGGQADIVLEEGVDILDSGIEIVARPPGKEPRNISLLSGGEKTLTCVALLLAVFQYRPSPFCVLDEVDASLDEANIERFIGVLQEFLSWTQFIVVTHSKKTMTCATTLYGVTMQESGVSKRVSVRFEDVSEDGQIVISNDRATQEESSVEPKDETQAA